MKKLHNIISSINQPVGVLHLSAGKYIQNTGHGLLRLLRLTLIDDVHSNHILKWFNNPKIKELRGRSNLLKSVNKAKVTEFKSNTIYSMSAMGFKGVMGFVASCRLFWIYLYFLCVYFF